MKKQNKNFLYNIVYQIFSFIVPLIITPYISRILGADNIGIYSYTYSIVYYFMLVAMLGINNYGAREIAKCKNKSELSKKFVSIYGLQFILGILSIILYLILIVFINYQHKIIMVINLIFLISAVFDINWFFFGVEKFKVTISRNIIIKILSLVFIFLLVRKSSDLWIYTVIMSLSTLISQLYLWLFIKKETDFTKVSLKSIFSNLKPCLILFIPVISYSIYRVMDKTMIGAITNTIELGNYESAEKIINIPIAFVTALGTVMMPYMAKKNKKEIISSICDTFELSFFITLPMIIGLMVTSNDIAYILFGSDFSKAGNIIAILSITILFSSVSNVIRTNYLIPLKQDVVYVKSTILGAMINFISNAIFIRRYASYGACIGTVLAEISLMIYQVLYTRKQINYYKVIKIFFKYLFGAMFIGGICLIIGVFVNNVYLKVVVQIIISLIVYCILYHSFIIYNFLGKGSKNNISNNKKNIVDISNDINTSLIEEEPILSSDSYINNDTPILDKDLIPEEVYRDRESLSRAIRNDSSYIRYIDFNYRYDFDIVDLILEESKIYSYVFHNEDYLRNNKYPTILSNNHTFVKYVIDKDFNNIFYVDTRCMSDEEVRGLINYTFRKVYYLREDDRGINFNINKFSYSDIMNDSYFQECLKYLR